MNLREAAAGEVPALIQMRIAYLRDDHGTLSQEQIAAVTAQLTAYFPAHIGRDCFAFVAEEEGRWVSAALLTVAEKPANLAFPRGRVGTLMNVYTLPAYRRRGLAAQLVGMALEKGRALGLDQVELMATDMGRPLYARLGFAPRSSAYLPMVHRYT